MLHKKEISLFETSLYVLYNIIGPVRMEPCNILVPAVPCYLLARIYARVLLYLLYCEIKRPFSVKVLEYLLVSYRVE